MTKTKNSSVSPSHFIDLFLRVNSSKDIPRTGWKMQGIESPESVAEHTFSLSFLTMLLTPILSGAIDYPLNINKLVKMAVLHDVGEVETGDIVVARGSVIDMQKRAEKEEKEKKGIASLFKATDKSNLYLELFSEMIERKTVEASIFWQLDKLDMAVQALSYEKTTDKDLTEFFDNARANISHEFLRELLEEIITRRPKR